MAELLSPEGAGSYSECVCTARAGIRKFIETPCLVWKCSWISETEQTGDELMEKQV